MTIGPPPMTSARQTAREIAEQAVRLFVADYPETTRPAIEFIESAILSEREECAKVAEKLGSDLGESAIGHTIATAIRSRSDSRPVGEA